MKEERGITLIALVITIVVMLILAGVSISVLTDDGGVFDKTSMATKEYKKQSIIEAIENAELQLEIEAELDSSIEKNISNLINKLKEISDINDENYIISVDDAEQTATIIDKKTGIVIDIKILPNGKVDIESSVVDDITDVVKPEITYTLNPKVGNYADEVTITVTVREETNGIVKLQMPDNTERTYDNQIEVVETYTVNKNGIYKFTAEGANGRRISCYVDVRNAMNPADIQITLLNQEATQEAQVQIVYDNNLPDLTNSNKYQYSIGENNWQTATANQTIKVTVNETVYARYYDGKVGHKTVSLGISNVDRVAPNEFDLTATPNSTSIKVTGATTDNGSEGTAVSNIGIRGYQFQLKDSEGKVLVDWTTEQQVTSYTFNNLEEETEYKVSMRAIDKAGNVREARNNNYVIATIKGAPIASKVKVGDFVNYDAGTWTTADFTKITSSSGRPTVNKSTALPTTQGQFGGFTLGQSRNSNSTEYNSSYKPKYSGWRVWDINESTGEVTLISAGHPETYYHYNNSTASINILRNRDCSMYENQYAKEDSAHILTGQEAARWYNKQFGTNYTIVDNGGSTSSTFWNKTFTTNYPIDVLQNGSYYWLASPYDLSYLYSVGPGNRGVNYNHYKYGFGVRVLVSLKSGVQVEQGTATGGVTTWNIVGN